MDEQIIHISVLIVGLIILVVVTKLQSTYVNVEKSTYVNIIVHIYPHIPVDKTFLYDILEVGETEMKYGKIIQPDGINYMIQELHYSTQYAQAYVDMLISKMESYIELKQQGKRVAPLMTLEQMKSQLEIMKKFKVVEVDKV